MAINPLKKKMKTETRIADIQKHLSATAAEKAAKSARSAALKATERAICGECGDYDPSRLIAAAREQKRESDTAAAALAKIPRERRYLAARTVKIAEEIGTAAARLGEDYSGSTSHSVRWGGSSSAITHTDAGERYSYPCTYRKTDAQHVVTLCPAGVVALV